MNSHQSSVACKQRKRLQASIDRFEARIRRRLLGKLQMIGRGAYDLDDVMSSVRRRVDAACVNRAIRARSECELAAYIFRVAESTALQALRRECRLQQRSSQAAQRELSIDKGKESASDVDASLQIMQKLDPQDRHMLELWARGLSHLQVAGAMGFSFEAFRSRWRRLRQRLRDLAARELAD